jgi:hypothetical protein
MERLEMIDIEEITAELEAQDGVNCAILEVLKRVASTVALRLPIEFRADFHEMLENIPTEFEPFREMPVNSQEAFSHVVSVVSDTVKELL